MWKDQSGKIVEEFGEYIGADGTRYPSGFPRNQIPGLTELTVVQPPLSQCQSYGDPYLQGNKYIFPVITPPLSELKALKNLEINAWRAAANHSSFTHLGKVIACDELSRSDIDAVAGSISLTGAFPAGFPGAWKAVDNTYIMLPDIAAFKAMYNSMTTQGTQNFLYSQLLKTALAAATSIEEINAVVW